MCWYQHESRGCLGIQIDLGRVPRGPGAGRDDFILFSESPGRFLVSVAPENRAVFERRIRTIPSALIGKVISDPEIRILGIDGREVIIPISAGKAAYKGTFGGW